MAQAVAQGAEAGAGDDQETAVARDFLAETRVAAARLLGAQPGEIALVGPTSLALSFVANGLDLRRNTNAVIYFDDYPSNVYPWMTLADRGVEVRFLNVRRLGELRAAEVLGQVDENTRLVALASAHFISGWRLELPRLGQALRSRGILFCVDGIQTLGAFPTTVEHVDVLAADAHKWLLGPCAAGILYVREAVQDRIAPSVYGWHNLRCPEFVAQEDLMFRNDARRYEAGSANLLGLLGLRAALDLLAEVGLPAITVDLQQKRFWLVRELLQRGYEVLAADAPPENAGGITTFHRPGADLPALHHRLSEAGVVTSLRRDRSGRAYLRLSPHYYNTQAELGRVLELL
ncbi:MAG: aminotransferase class V-fold PLP-dependent enzyme [Verrucomicrobia bacterium]|nr:aminotransferase class V-fold PLP-dependent enzyme [Verrucomicrobiota bacterium]